MKKLSLFILFFVTICCYGNDIIITTQSEKLEVTIVEVGKTEIKYRKVNNPTGPLFVLDKADISSIIYDNGDVETFTVSTITETVNNQINNVENKSSLITRYGNNRYAMDGKIMSSKELGYFFKGNCDEAYSQWAKGTSYQNCGIAGVIIGPILCLPLGLSLYASSGYSDASGKHITRPAAATVGIFFMAFGTAMTVVSIPIMIIGIQDRNDAYLAYNNICAQSGPKLSLNFQMKSDGVGLALNF